MSKLAVANDTPEDDRRESFVGEDDKSSAGVLAALRKAEDAFREWQTTCGVIDDIYSRKGYDPAGRRTDDGYAWQDGALDMFWASFEILKPAVYARPPQPVVTPMFKDSKRLPNLTAELLERAAVSVFKRTDMNEVMLGIRDDLIFAGRGAMWLRYEDEDGQQVCVEHKDRLDFLHEPSRKWSEVGWVAAAAWMTKAQMRKRFSQHSGTAYEDAKYEEVESDGAASEQTRARTRRCKVWEVWHKADNRVYWVTDGVNEFLDQDAPHLDLTGFFPCPRPAFATLARRSLVPVPDYERYALHFDKISELTGRIYVLLDSVKMKGLIPAGGDVGDSIEQLMASDDDKMLIPVPSAAMMAAGPSGFVMWLPLAEVAAAIQGLIAARQQLIEDFYQLSGISDIMRGATEANETLGAQQLKSQYGSVRVREKSMELQRVAADAVAIAAEIIAEKFTAKTLLDMTQLEIPTKAAIEKRVKEVENAAKEELEGLAKQAEQAAQQLQGQQAQQGQQQPQQPGMAPQQGPQSIDPAQAQQAFQQAQQQTLQKYAPMLAEAEAQVPIEAVMSLLRDSRARTFTFEIESSSTILTDELSEKSSRNEFMGQFTASSQAMMGLAAMGEQGAKLAGALMKFTLAPYRVGRELDGIIDEFIDAAPQMAAAAKGDQGDSEALAEANKTLAEAEQLKAQAAMASVQSKSELGQADMQRKLMEMQQKGQIEADKHARESEKLSQQLQDMAGRETLLQAQVDNLTANTAKILHSIGLDERKQELSEYTAASQQHDKQIDREIQADNAQVDQQFRERGEQRADHQAFAGQEPE